MSFSATTLRVVPLRWVQWIIWWWRPSSQEVWEIWKSAGDRSTGVDAEMTRGSPDIETRSFSTGFCASSAFVLEAMLGPRNTVSRYCLPLVAVCLTTVARVVVDPWLADHSHFLSFSIAVLVSGMLGGIGPGIVAVLLSLLAGGYLFMPEFPRGEFFGASLGPHALLFLLTSSAILYVAHATRRARQRAEAALSELEKREELLRTVIEALPVGIWFADQTGRIVTGNEAGRKIWGGARYVGPEEYSLYKMWWADSGKRVPQEELALVRAFRKGESSLNEVLEIETFQGERRSILNSVIPLRMNEGPIFGAVVVNEDITQRRAAMEELQRAKEGAESANFAKDRFLAVLSHELRTPLTPVLMTAEAIESRRDVPEDIRSDISLIRRHVSLEARLIDDLLDLTRIEKGKLHLERHKVSLHDIIETAVEMVRSEARRKDIAINVNLNIKNLYIDGDRARIKQVFWNLLGNALKFTPAGGKIAIRAEDASDFVRVAVTDTGIGIGPEALETIFNAFEQADANHRRFGGLGLGLAIAKSLVELHCGHIEAHSAGIGRGATFTVYLPATEAPQKIPQPVLFMPPEATHSRLHILLVEDHEPTAFVLARLLKRRGHEVRLAATVAEAIAQEDYALNLLVSDIGLPDGTGIDVVRHFRSTGREFKAVALSGFGMENDVERSLNAGFDRHLTKPVDFETLQSVISELFHDALIC